MHKEDVDVVHKLRKDYRSYIGQGIPDSHIFSNPPRQAIPSCKDLKENLKKYLLPLLDKSKSKANCHCCEINYLFECPDKCGTKNRNCTCKTCHSKESNVGDECNCIEILQTWALQNTHLKERRRKEGRKKLTKSRDSLNGCETDYEGSNSSSSATCLCPRNYRTNESVSSSEPQSKNAYSKELAHGSCNESKEFFPYIRSSKHVRVREVKMSSKEIQTEVIGDTKVVQTENAENKMRGSGKCFRCNVYQCQMCRMEKNRLPPNVVQNHVVTCPYVCHDHVSHDQKKEKKKKEKMRKEGSSGDHLRHCKMEENAGKPIDCCKCSETQTFHNLLKMNDSDCCQPSMKNFKNLKYLTDSRLKNYLRMRETLRRYKTDLHDNETANQGEESNSSQKFEKSKVSYSKPNETSCTESPMKNEFGMTRQKHDKGIVTELKKSDVVTKYFNEIQESDGSRTYGLVRSHKSRKRMKLACGRRRRKIVGRKKLVHKNTQVGRGELSKEGEKSSEEEKEEHRRRIAEFSEKFKQFADGYRIPERGTLVELFKPTGFGKMSETRRSPLVLKFRAGDLDTEK